MKKTYYLAKEYVNSQRRFIPKNTVWTLLELKRIKLKRTVIKSCFEKIRCDSHNVFDFFGVRYIAKEGIIRRKY